MSRFCCYPTENQTRVKGGVKGESNRVDSPARVNCLIKYRGNRVLTLSPESCKYSVSESSFRGSRFWDKSWTRDDSGLVFSAV